jgi:uncharacterized protein YbjT (DUF2867 family)
MKIVVVGGTGLIGSAVVTNLSRNGHDTTPASPNSGVNTLTGEGLADALDGAAVVVDVSNAPSFEDDAVLEFFDTSTRNIIDGMIGAGAQHLVALSVVGDDRLPDSGYLRAKVAQEKLITSSNIPYSIVRATQFFEFIGRIADSATEGNTVRLPPVLFQPAAAADVSAVVSEVAQHAPLMSVLEIGGPEQFRFDELVREHLEAHGGGRTVVADPHARYFGTELAERSLVPADGARLLPTTYDEWARASARRDS